MTTPTEASSPSDPLPDDVAVSSTASVDVSADPSPAEDSGANTAPKSLIDVLRDAVAPEDPAGAESPTPAVKENEPAEASAAPETVAEPDDSKLPFDKHPRWQQVRQEAAAAKTELAEIRQRLPDLEHAAKEFGGIETFRQANGLSTAEVVGALKREALVKNDPEAALKELMPVVDRLLELTGRLLPADLKSDVEEGRITEERARELSTTRAKAALAEGRVQAVTERTTQDETARAAAAARAEVEAATQEWETRTKEKDPDFDAKQPFILDRARVIAAEKGYPRNKAEAQALVQAAYDDVTASARRFVPSKTAIRRPPAASPSTEALPAPKTLREAIRASVNG